jgi:hypothetical protein
MSAIKCHFDGKVIIPDEPVDSPVNKPLPVRIEPGVAYVDPPDGRPGTVADLLKFAGIWKHRTDIQDSTEFVRQLREQARAQRNEP